MMLINSILGSPDLGSALLLTKVPINKITTNLHEVYIRMADLHSSLNLMQIRDYLNVSCS